jgi:glycogen(starch) synthase
VKTLIKSGLDNKEDDKIKVIFYPAPVSVADGLLSMEYHEVVSGMHLGIFPSLYEPWGYTPLETAGHGVISITTDVSGFGSFIQQHSDQRKKPGILILNTENKKREQIVDELENMMHWVTKLPRKERVAKKLEAHRLAKLADWSEFAKYYIKAHNLAVERYKARQKSKKK